MNEVFFISSLWFQIFKYIKQVGENFLLVKDLILRTQDLYERQFDKKHIIAPEFNVDDKVWINIQPVFASIENAKLAPRKYGPYNVLEK